ncbi:abortive infection family protein [Flagellimonas sp. HMM57]|uniref:abortive infection family protein n=1 Tax=unclassified Flagellimonas TaxID=2644544 RepID=UPI0013D1E8E4|nr:MULTISPECIES: abortive infection family protein [unclassified Flagellimonas]UII74869.1 abortive infection family protein [Flagellimonas sp. HMM57]
MADLSYKEKLIIERLFDMRSGYVMDFSNRTFQEFIYDSLKIDIYDSKYDYESGSKANRLRAFFKEESNHRVSLLLSDLLDYWLTKAQIGEYGFEISNENLHEKCLKITERLKKEIIVEEIEAIKEFDYDRDFTLLAKSIKESIEKNEPETALDRLHTYLMKLIRQLCENHTIEIKKDEPLNSLFGKYVKYVVSKGEIESQMAERILKYSIHVLEAFNDIRNNRSFAHDNPILNYSESILIFNNVTNTIKFVESIEKEMERKNKREEEKRKMEGADWDDLPF